MPAFHAFGAAFTLVVVIACCVWLVESAGRRVVKETLNEELSAMARLAADRLDVVGHAMLVDDSQQNGEAYRRVVAPFREMLRAVPEFRYIYTLRPTPEGLRFIADAAEPIDSDKDGVIDQATLGEACDEPDEAMARALRDREVTISDVPYTDKWGSFISAYAPVFNAEGDIECLVGIDITASTYLARLDRIRQAASLSYAVGTITSIGIGMLVGPLKRNRRIDQCRRAIQPARLNTGSETRAA